MYTKESVSQVDSLLVVQMMITIFALLSLRRNNEHRLELLQMAVQLADGLLKRRHDTEAKRWWRMLCLLPGWPQIPREPMLVGSRKSSYYEIYKRLPD